MTKQIDLGIGRSPTQNAQFGLDQESARRNDRLTVDQGRDRRLLIHPLSHGLAIDGRRCRPAGRNESGGQAGEASFRRWRRLMHRGQDRRVFVRQPLLDRDRRGWQGLVKSNRLLHAAAGGMRRKHQPDARRMLEPVGPRQQPPAAISIDETQFGHKTRTLAPDLKAALPSLALSSLGLSGKPQPDGGDQLGAIVAQPQQTQNRLRLPASGWKTGADAEGIAGALIQRLRQARGGAPSWSTTRVSGIDSGKTGASGGVRSGAGGKIGESCVSA